MSLFLSSICLSGINVQLCILFSHVHFIESLSIKGSQDRILNLSFFFLSHEHFRFAFLISVENINEDQRKRFFDRWDITLIKTMREKKVSLP